jgi:hypothetical protein
MKKGKQTHGESQGFAISPRALQKTPSESDDDGEDEEDKKDFELLSSASKPYKRVKPSHDFRPQV